MNKDINRTLAALIPVLQMNGENVVSIEAVHDWYKGQYKDSDGRHREYMKEVAEITYASGHVKYADIGCDSNLTACYDVLAVIQQLKRESAVIERMEHEIDRIECAIRHIESSLDVDPWACEIAVHAMRELIKRTRWTSVEQELPEDGVTVWVTIRGHDVITCEEGETLEQAIARISRIRWVTQGYWSEEEHGWNDPSFGCPLMVKPIAWMPMEVPEPWRGGQDEQT